MWQAFNMNTQRLSIIFLVMLSLFGITVAVLPEWRSQAKALFTSSERKIIAKTEGALTPQGPHVTVLKIEEAAQLFLEIYDNSNPEEVHLMSRIRLDEKRDAHFTYQGNATNLAMGDMDSDGTMEIFCPVFDDQMVARLHIYKYNRDTQSFDRINSTQSENSIPK